MKNKGILKARQFSIALKRPLVMGVLNITPDSFSDGSNFIEPKKALRHALKMIGEGADIIDIGAESTRPGARPAPPEVQIRRLSPVIRELRSINRVPVSVDTYSYDVAQFALEQGASIINDINGCRLNRRLASLVAKYDAAIILMHMKGTPATMQSRPRYGDVLREVITRLKKSAGLAKDCGIGVNSILIDPGIGFGKTVSHNLEILKKIGFLKKSLGLPIVIGASRKSFIGKVLDKPLDNRLCGSVAAAVVSVINGADIVRAHDVAQTRDALMMAHAIRNCADKPKWN